jgi:hypothetical protein
LIRVEFLETAEPDLESSEVNYSTAKPKPSSLAMVASKTSFKRMELL